MKMMDGNSSDPSPPLSDNAGGSWNHWENELSSVSGLHLGSDLELSGLVEDKEIAARAVAFVVNSTRKGIVPLCSDVANLLKSKRSLEKKVYLLKRDNEALRSAASLGFCTSQSASPTPTSSHSHSHSHSHCLTDKGLLHDQALHAQERSRPCSRCSQCSSTVSSSPRLEKTYSFRGQLPSPSVSRHQRRRSSPRTPHRALPPDVTGSDPGDSVLHDRPSFCMSETSRVLMDSPLLGLAAQVQVHRQEGLEAPSRKNSLPEMVSVPDGKLQRVSSTVSKETQCSIPSQSEASLEEKCAETLHHNQQLTEALSAAQREVETLKARLRELEMWKSSLSEEGASAKGDNAGAITSPDTSSPSVNQKSQDVHSRDANRPQGPASKPPVSIQKASPASPPSQPSPKQDAARERGREARAEEGRLPGGKDGSRPEVDRQETCAAAKQKAQRNKRDMRIVNREPALV